MTIAAIYPDLNVLLGLAPAELAPAVLRRAWEATQETRRNLFNPYSLRQTLTGMSTGREVAYGREHLPAVENAISEALNWLATNGLTMPDLDPSSGSNWYSLTKDGIAAAQSKEAFDQYARAAAFPKALLHPRIAEKAWLSIARGELSDAVFTAFRTVEERVREVGGYGLADYGAELMRKAFHPQNGPLAKYADPESEKEGLRNLATGAISSYKNPHSHRTVVINEALEAQEMVMLASHLLRIVDSREEERAAAARRSTAMHQRYEA